MPADTLGPADAKYIDDELACPHCQATRSHDPGWHLSPGRDGTRVLDCINCGYMATIADGVVVQHVDHSAPEGANYQ